MKLVVFTYHSGLTTLCLIIDDEYYEIKCSVGFSAYLDYGIVEELSTGIEL